jgi:hypothetical protein
MRASLKSLMRRITWLLLVALLLPAMGATAIGGETGVQLEMLVCSSAGSIPLDAGGEPERERPGGTGHCVFCFAPTCAPPAAAPALVLAGLADLASRPPRHDPVHLPDPPGWLKAPVRAPPVSIS